MSRSSRFYLGAIAVATVAYFFLSTGTQSLLYDAIGVSAGVAMLASVRRFRPEPGPAWVLLGVGVLLHAGGDIVFGTSQPVPSPADMLYISSYPLMALGIIGLTAHRAQQREGSGLISAVAYSASVAILAWLFLIAPAGHQHGVGAATLGVSIGYPVMDVILLGLVFRAARAERGRTGTYGFLYAGLVLLLVADAGYAVQDFGMTYALGGWLDAAWLLSYGCFGAALLELSSQPARGGAPPILPAHAASPAPIRSTALQALRYRLVVSWTGRMLAGFGAISFLAGAAWTSTELVMLAGAYGIMGVLMMIAGSMRTTGRSPSVGRARPATSRTAARSWASS